MIDRANPISHLKAVVHFDHPSVIGLNKDVSFCSDVCQLLFGYHISLSENFHSINMTSVNFLNQSDLERKTKKGWLHWIHT